MIRLRNIVVGSLDITVGFCISIVCTAGCQPAGDTRSEAPVQRQPAPTYDREAANLSGQQPATSRMKPLDVDRTLSARLQEVDTMAQKVDVANDDWKIEQLTAAVNRQMERLQTLLIRPTKLTADSLASLVDPRIVSSALIPNDLQAVHDDTPFIVLRSKSSLRGNAVDQPSRDGFAESLAQLRTKQLPGECHVKFKLIHIQPNDDFFETNIRYEGSYAPSQLASAESQTPYQQTAMWTCHWTYPSESDPDPRMVRVELRDFEQVEMTTAGGQLFVDRTHAVLAEYAGESEQFFRGVPEWLDIIPSEFIDQFGHHGMAIGDVNGDDLDDIYVCDVGGLPNRLFIQQKNGTAIEQSAKSGVDFLDNSVSALLVDFDNDGDQDLAVVLDSQLVIAENDSHGVFGIRAQVAVNTDAFSICSADYDTDGDLDLYVCGYEARQRDTTGRSLPFPVPYDDANNGGRNVLFRNEGNFQFRDVTDEVGLDQHNQRFSMAASWEDYDNDGDQDLYVANDFGRNNLFRNEGGQFKDVAGELGVEDHASGMSVSWGDCDQDGWMDLYVGNMFSAAGNRVTYQRRFANGIANQAAARLQRMARGNTLFLNRRSRAATTFEDVSESTGVTMGRWAWASKFVDITNNGWLDLVIANGYLTNENSDDL